ncbi:MAG: T9SS type A sorting domain-containing protein, partial [Syntrophothermus sp.]
LWSATYNGPGNSFDEISSIALDNNGYIYVTGMSSGGAGAGSDIATLKYNSDGQLIWTSRFNGPAGLEDFANNIAVCGNGDIVVTGGSTFSGAAMDIITLRYTPVGNLLWQKHFNGSASLQDIGNSLVIDASDNVYVTGQINNSSSSSTSGDAVTIKYAPNGTELWVKTYNGTGNTKDWASKAAISSDGSLYVEGTSGSASTGNDYLTIRYKSDGTQEWTGLYNSSGSAVDQAEDIVSNSSGIFVTGTTGIDSQGKITTIKYSSSAPPPPPALSAPILISPAQNTRIAASTIKFIWHKSSGAESYQLQISENSDFSVTVYDASSISDTSKELNIFTLNKTYYWRVKARNSQTSSSWSDVLSFNTNAAASVRITIGNSAASIGDTVLVPVTAADFTDIGGITLKISYETAALRFLNIVNINSQLDGILASGSGGVITIAWDSEKGANISSGKLFDLQFIFEGPSFISQVNFLPQTEVVGLTGNKLTPVLTNGYVTGGFILSGLLLYDCDAVIPLINSTIYLIQDKIIKDSVFTGSNGLFQFLKVLKGIYSIAIHTNMPWSGVNSTDALLIRKHIVGQLTLQGLKLKGADVNAVNGISSADPLMIRRRIVGLDNSFALGDWLFEETNINIGGGNFLQNIKGLAVGDVNGSYGSGLNKAGSVALNLKGSLSINPHNEFTIPVSVVNASELGAITLFIDFPEEYAELKNISGIPEGFLYNVVGNQIRIAWDDIRALQIKEGETLFTLTFKPKDKLIYAGSFNIEIASASEFADKDAAALSVALSIPKIELAPPSDFSLSQNYPNPFNPATSIEYTMPVNGKVTLEIYNTLGEKIATLVNGSQAAGVYKADWNATNQKSGIYIYRISVSSETKNYLEARKMVLLK